VDETPAFQEEAEHGEVPAAPIVMAVRENGSDMLRVICMALMNAIPTTVTVFGLTYATSAGYGVGLTSTNYLWISVSGSASPGLEGFFRHDRGQRQEDGGGDDLAGLRALQGEAAEVATPTERRMFQDHRAGAGDLTADRKALEQRRGGHPHPVRGEPVGQDRPTTCDDLRHAGVGNPGIPLPVLRQPGQSRNVVPCLPC
jgi:hypothetical protein